MPSRLAIISPCARSWSDLHGDQSDGRVRFCDSCQTPVHAVEQYEDAEWQRVWHESNGQVCGLLTEPPAVEHRSRRAVLFGALLTVVSPLLAAAGRVRIRVVYAPGHPISDASVSLNERDGKPILTRHADANGVVVFSDLPMGDSQFEASCQGFASSTITVTIVGSEEVTRDVILKVGTVGTVIAVQSQ